MYMSKRKGLSPPRVLTEKEDGVPDVTGKADKGHGIGTFLLRVWTSS